MTSSASASSRVPPAPPSSTDTRRRWIGGIIVAFWLVMMGWLLYGQLPRGSSEGATEMWSPGDTWYGLYLGEEIVAGPITRESAGERQRIGVLRVTRTEEERQGDGETPEAGYRTDLTAQLGLALFGEPAHLDLTGRMWRARDGEPLELDFQLESRQQRTEVHARLQDGRLRGTVETGGEVTPLDFPVDGDLLLSGGLGGLQRLAVPAVGEQVELDSFDPLTLGRGRATLRSLAVEPIEVADESVEATRVEVTAAGMRSIAWVAEDGEVLRVTTPLGFTLERIAAPSDILAPDPDSASGTTFGPTLDRPLDPTLDQPLGPPLDPLGPPLVGATQRELLEEGAENWNRLLLYLGHSEVTIVDEEPTSDQEEPP